MLDRCTPEDVEDGDGRCVLRSRTDPTTLSRCICGYGLDEDDTSTQCSPLLCDTLGTDQSGGSFQFQVIAGYWSCVCRAGWSGKLCDVHRPNPYPCGNGTWIGDRCVCDQPNTVMVHDAHIGNYCALRCVHGAYNYAETKCDCGAVTRYFGPLCEHRYPPPPVPPEPGSSSSTGGGDDDEMRTMSDEGQVVRWSMGALGMTVAALLALLSIALVLLKRPTTSSPSIQASASASSRLLERMPLL
jgi:hypothetical protein